MLSLSLADERHGNNAIRRGPAIPQLIERSRLLALYYLVALAVAEIVTALVDARWGTVIHGMLLVVLMVQGALAAYVAPHRRIPSPVGLIASFTAALALAPLTRLVSLSIPSTEIPRSALYALYAVPMLAAAWSAARANGYDRYDIGLRWDPLPRSIVAVVALGVSGVAIGYAEYLILTPDPLVATIAPLPLVVAAVSIIFGTGITEEVIFRGVLQRASIDLLGGRAGIVYAAAVFAVLHIGHRSALDVAFVFLIGLIFGVAVWATRSLAGVIAAHSITNLCVFLVFPLLRVR